MVFKKIGRRKLLKTVLAAGAATGLAGCEAGEETDTETDTTSPGETATEPTDTTPTPTPTPAQQGDVEETRRELEPYTDPLAAWNDGYTNTMEYVASEDGSGGMGVHFTNPDVEGLDPLQPHALLYDITDEGRYELLGAHWGVPAEDVDEAPRLFGETFQGPAQGFRARQPEMYSLQAWLFADNPEGQFATFNPDVTPPSFAAAYTDVGFATRPFRNVDRARQAGFARRGDCRSGDNGNEGVNFLSTADPYNRSGTVYHSNLQSLLYESTDDGMSFVGVKWLLPVDEVESRPTLVGQSMRGPTEGYFEEMPTHYELKLWRKPNPNGLFARWNPVVDC